MFFKILVKHSAIIINDYNMGDCAILEKVFTIFDPINHSRFIYGLYYNEETKQLFIPRGVDIPYIEKLFGCVAHVSTTPDPYDHTDEIMIKYLPRDDAQKETLDFMIGVTNAYKFTKFKSQLAVNLPTGKGKSYCSIATMAFSRIRSIIITSSINWLNQWEGYIYEYTDIKPREIFRLQGTPSIHSLLKKDMSQYKIILASMDTIKSYGDKYGWDAVSELFIFMRIGYKFYDECHLNFETMAMIDYHTNTFKTFYITATPARSSEAEHNIYKLYFKNIPAIDLFDAEEDPHTHYISFRYKSLPTAEEKSNCRGRFKLDRNKYTEYLLNKPNFYKMIKIIIHHAMMMNGKCLIYIGTNNAILKIKSWLEFNYPELRGQIGVYTSIITENKDLELEKKIILSTTKSCGPAMDIKNLKMTVVLAEPFKSDVTAVQTLGRTRDNNTYYIEVVDDSFNTITDYYRQKHFIISKYALDMQEVKFSDRDLNFKVEQVTMDRLNKLYPIINGLRTVYYKTDLKTVYTRVGI